MDIMTPRRIFRAGLLACVGMAGLCLPGSPALAQRFDPFDRLGTLQAADNPLDQEKRVGVADRSRPEYSAVPIKLGSLQVMPQLLLKLDTDDNIYAVKNPRAGDEILHVRPRLSISRPSPDLSWSIAGEYDGARYFSHQSENSNDYALQGQAHYTIHHDTGFDLRLLQSRNSEQRTSPDSPTAAARPTQFYLTEAYGDLSQVFGRASLRATLDFERRNYLDNANAAGVVIDQDFRDRSTVTGGLIAQYAMSPRFALFTAVSGNSRDYRARVGPVPARDSTGYELALGANFDLGHLVHSTIRLGYMQQDYKDPLFRDVHGLLIRGEAAYYLTPLVTLTAKIDRDISETGVVEAAGYVRTTSSLQADYELLRNLILRAQIGNEHRAFVGIDRTDNRFSGDLSSTWLLNRRMSLQMSLLHRAQKSVGLLAGRDFSENRLSVAVVLKGL